MSTIRCVLRGCTLNHKTLISVEDCDREAFFVFQAEFAEELKRERAAIPKYDPAIRYCWFPPCGKLLPELKPGGSKRPYCGINCVMGHYQWRARREGTYIHGQAPISEGRRV